MFLARRIVAGRKEAAVKILVYKIRRKYIFSADVARAARWETRAGCGSWLPAVKFPWPLGTTAGNRRFWREGRVYALDSTNTFSLRGLRLRGRRIGGADRRRRRFADDAAAGPVVWHPSGHSGRHGPALRRHHQDQRNHRP